MTDRELNKKLEKLRVTIKSEKEDLQMYILGFNEAEKNYIKSRNRIIEKQKKIEKKIDDLHYEIRGLIKNGK